MNDLEKEFVPYQQSLDMKKLGFDELCLGLYHNDKTFYPTQCKSHEEYHGQVCSALLYQQAFRFFREKYPYLDFAVGKIYNGSNTYHYHINLLWEYFEGTYEEAELACLIKLIELAKSGSLKA